MRSAHFVPVFPRAPRRDFLCSAPECSNAPSDRSEQGSRRSVSMKAALWPDIATSTLFGSLFLPHLFSVVKRLTKTVDVSLHVLPATDNMT